MRKKIGINIDGVLRNFIERFEKVYISTYISNPSLVEANEDMTLKILSSEEEVEKEKSIGDQIKDRVKKPIDSFDLLNHFKFESGKNHLGDEVGPQEMLETFMYEMKAFNIFGQANTIQGADMAFHRLQSIGIQEDAYDIVLLSTLKDKAITATFSFLGNSSFKTREVLFLDSDYEKWDKCDIVIDVMPETFQTKPDEKMSIKISTEYNKWDAADHEFSDLRSISKDGDFIKKILEFCKE